MGWYFEHCKKLLGFPVLLLRIIENIGAIAYLELPQKKGAAAPKQTD